MSNQGAPALLATCVKTQHVFKNMPKLDTQFITFFCPALQDRDLKCRQHWCSRHRVSRGFLTESNQCGPKKHNSCGVGDEEEFSEIWSKTRLNRLFSLKLPKAKYTEKCIVILSNNPKTPIFALVLKKG